MIEEGMKAGMYERTITANGKLLQWNAAPVLVLKKDQAQSRLTFSYHFIFEEKPASHMELVTRIHDLLTNPSHKTLGQFDIKHDY